MRSSTNVTRSTNIAPPWSLASVMTLSCTDVGHLTLEFPEHGQNQITGRLEHLNIVELIASVERGFTIRYLDSSARKLVELQRCKALDVDQNGAIQFYTDLEQVSEFAVEGDFDAAQMMFQQIHQTISPKQFGHIVFVLGAGASVESLPAGADLLRKLLQDSPEGEAQRFIADVFKAKLRDELPFISFNQVLNVIDIALERDEGFSARYTLDKLRDIKRQLITELRQFMIDQADQSADNSYIELAHHLREFYDGGGRVSFVNLNYDLLLDRALQTVFDADDLNYILPFRQWNYGKPSIISSDHSVENPDRRVNVVKLHGSLDWMICPTCFEPYLFSGTDLQKSLSNRQCSEDHTLLQEFLFPPTRERVEVHSHWIKLQHEADRLLRSADKVVFIGFSLSDDDAHFRYKLTKHLYRPENPVCVQVVGRPKERYDIALDNLAWHYWQFFGPVDYRPTGFSTFSKNPF